MDPLQPITSSVHDVQMVPVGSVSNMPPVHVQTLKPNEQMKLLEPMAHYGNASANSSALHMMPGTNYSGFQQLTVPNSGSRDMGAIFTNLKAQNVQMPVKRKSPMENLPGYPLSPTEGMQNKKIGQLEHRPWLNIYAPNQSNVQHQVQSLAGVLASQQWAAKKKRTTQFQAGPPKSSFLNFPSPRSHPIQVNPSPRGQNESNESVRSKLRESISAALALVTKKDKSSSKEGATVSDGAIASERTQEGSQSAEIASFVSPAELSVEKPKGENEDCTTQSQSKNNVECQLTPIASNLGGSPQTHESVSQELSISDMLPDEESIAGIFFAKDDLLQGNGLAWVSDFDAWVAEKEGHWPKKQRVSEKVGGAQEVKKINSPETLALQIEIELFKLFGGVNKKYKEKGRSLLFNLKDKNNPELREKVMSGEIPPARLCSMTPEELASKELSEWRIAKAEEFEHMKILPDSDIDIRRLVKKTHKGEYQVEVEEDDVSVEVSVGSSSFPRIQTEAKETKSPPGQISEGDHKETVNGENNSEERNPDGTITFPSNPSSDLMQGLIEDEFKDAEFLPPIVSLDEFMASLDSEPPFENISANADKTAASLDNYHSEMPSEAKSAKLSPDGHTKSAKLSPDGHTKSKLSPNGHTKSADNLDSKDLKLDKDSKPTNNQSQTEVSAPIVVSKGQPQTEVPAPMAVTKGERIWVGTLQLSNSSTISVSGFFKSGEKASTKDWPHTLEIKGRVRMDGFEKFLHDLYKSRSRSIMVMHVILKETEGKESEALNQVVDSYVADDRVGFAEPLRGIEVYLCPTHPKILDRIAKHLAKDHSEALSLGDGDKGLIGVFVWRKAHVPPNSSSHHKHSLKKHQQEHNNSSSRRHNQNHHQDRNMNMNSSNLKPKHPVVPLVQLKVTTTQSAPIKTVTDEDDVPPGFGPPASQDDDDLPEFNFSSGLTRSVPTQKHVVPQTQNRPVDQMRELIQKYGQNAGSGLVVKSWDDDDDDIPEWQPPQQPLPPPPQPASTQIKYQSINQPLLQHLINQQQQQQLLASHLQPPQAALPLPPQFPATQQNVAPGWPQQQQSGRWMNHQAPQSRGF